MKTDIHILSYLARFFLEWEMFPRKIVEKIKTHILFSGTLFRKSCRLWDNVEKYCRAGQATDDSMAHVHCMLDRSGYVILIAFPVQQSLHERASVLRYTYMTCPIGTQNLSLGVDSDFIVRFCICFRMPCSCVLTLCRIGTDVHFPLSEMGVAILAKRWLTTASGTIFT